MPRAKPVNGAEPKKRSRNGCWPCKARKVKCGEEKPQCANCIKQAEACDYSIRLQWGGRSKREQDAFSAIASPYTFAVSSGPPTPAPQANMTVSAPEGPAFARNSSQPSASIQSPTSFMIDPQLSVLSSGSWNGHTPSSQSQLTESYSMPSDSHYSSLPQLPPPNPYQADKSPSSGSFQSYSGTQFTQHPPSDFAWSSQHGAKRKRLSPSGSPRPTLPPVFARPELPSGIMGQTSHYDQQSPGSTFFLPYNTNSALNTPLTPDSSTISEDMNGRTQPRLNALGSRQTPHSRRLSVQSLLSGPSGEHRSPANHRSPHYPKADMDGATVYGYDHGLPDLDIPKNNDSMAISPQSPVSVRLDMHSPFAVGSAASSPSQPKEQAFERGGYYAQPVPIKILKEFEPLPHYLTDSPMNLLYFHHFLNHTARILAPHDCPDNPLKSILPKSTFEKLKGRLLRTS